MKIHLLTLLFIITSSTAFAEVSKGKKTVKKATLSNQFVEVFLNQCFKKKSPKEILENLDRSQWKPDKKYPDSVYVSTINGVSFGITPDANDSCIADVKAVQSGEVMMSKESMLDDLKGRTQYQVSAYRTEKSELYKDDGSVKLEYKVAVYELAPIKGEGNSMTVRFPQSDKDEVYVTVEYFYN